MSRPGGTAAADVPTGSGTRDWRSPVDWLVAAALDSPADVATGAGVASCFPPEHPARNPTAVTVPAPSVVRIARRDGACASAQAAAAPSAAFTAWPPGPRRDQSR